MSTRSAERVVDGAVLTLLVVELVTCFVAITMLSRLRATTDQAIQDAVRTTAIVEQELSRLALPPSQPESTAADYAHRLAELAELVPPSVESARLGLVADAAPTLARESAALERSVRGLSQIGAAARSSLEAARQAQAFRSRSAAWAMVFLGATLLLLAAMARGWLKRALVVPMAELCRVLEARARGDARARAAPAPFGTPFGVTMDAVNRVLDEMETMERGAVENQAASALGAWLDRQDGCSVMVTSDGRIVAASAAALALLASERGVRLREALHEAVAGSSVPSELVAVDPLGAGYRLCSLRDDAPASAQSQAPPAIAGPTDA